MRNSFPEGGPYRYISQEDIPKPFSNKLQKINHIDLPSLLDENCDSRHCLVYEGEKDEILAFLIIDDLDNHFYLNLIEKNEQFPIECTIHKPAVKLIDYVEEVARSRSHSRIEFRI